MADVNVNIASLKKSYSLKNKTSVSITGYTGTFGENIDDLLVSGSTLIITLSDNKKIKLTGIKDPKAISFITDGTQTLQAFYDDMIAIQDWTPKKGVKVTGSVFDDVIDLSETDYAPTGKAAKKNTGLTISAGVGNDTITGTQYNDTITGGAGENTIIYDRTKSATFGKDNIKLTKGEDLTLDLSQLNLSKESFKQNLSISGKNLVLNLSDTESINLVNFAKSNVVGDGSVTVLLHKGNPNDETDNDVLVDLNEDSLFKFTKADANKKGVIAGTRFADVISGGETVKTISGGAGGDEITSGEGDQKISGGIGADTFIFAKGDGVDTITDATKDDVIKIVDNTVNEADLVFAKNGNNLEVFFSEDLDETNKIVVSNYFKQKADQRIQNVYVNNDATPIDISAQKYVIQATSSVVGTDNDDTIKAGLAKKAITITGGQGDDTITGGQNKNTYVFNIGDGDDTIINAKKGDVLQFNANCKYDYSNNGNDLIIKYGLDENDVANWDSVTIKDFFATSDPIDTFKTKKGKKYATGSLYNSINIVRDHVITADADHNGAYNKVSPYAETITIDPEVTGGVTITGLAEKDILMLGDVPEYSRANNGGLVINDTITVTDFFEKGTDFTISDGTEAGTVSTSDAVIGVTLSDGYEYTSTKYKEVFSGTGTVKGITENDAITVTGAVCNRVAGVNDLTVTGTSGSIKVADFFKTNKDIKVNGSSIKDMTINVELTGGTYVATDYKEQFSGFGVVKGLNPEKDSLLVVDVDGNQPTFHRTVGKNDLEIVYSVPSDTAAHREVSIIVTNFFNMDGDMTVNYVDNEQAAQSMSTENMMLNVALAGKSYVATDYNEFIMGKGTVSGLNENDTILRYGDVIYNRVAGSNDLTVTGSKYPSEVVTVKDFFKNGKDINIKYGDYGTESTTTAGGDVVINVNLNGKAYEATKYNEVFSGSGSVSNLSASDKIKFAENTLVNYTLTSAGLVVKGGRNSVKVTDFANNKNLNVLVGETAETLSNLALTVSGISNFEGTDIFGSVIITGTSGADTLGGSAGADTYTGGKGADTFVVNGGYDRITDGTSDDTIKIEKIGADVTATLNDEGMLVIGYGNGNQVIVNNYKATATNNIDKILVKTEQGYDELSVATLLSGGGGDEPGDDTVLNIDRGATITINADDGIETLNFLGLENPEYLHYFTHENDSTIGQNDLVISQWHDITVTLKDYMLGGHCVKNFLVYGSEQYEIPYHIGTAGADTFDAQIIQDYFFTKGGDDIINFTGKDFTITNEIISEGASANTTTLIFDNYALEDDNMRLEYFKNSGGYNKLEIYFAKTEADGNHFGQIQYEDYFDNNKPTAIIQDSKEKTYYLNKYTEATTLNWTESESGNVAFLLGTSGTDSVTSNDQSNFVFSENGANLNYTYGGGKDKVYSESYVTDDTYNIGSFDKNTKLVIDDNGGSDTINLSNTSANDIRLFFDVSVTATQGEEPGSYEYHPYAYRNSAIVFSGTAGVFNATTLTNYLSNPDKWTAGVIATDFDRYNNDTETYEEMATIVTSDGNIDLAAWKNAVAQDVCAWFAEHRAAFDYSNLPSISGAIENGQLSGELLSELVSIYNKPYDTNS